MNPEEQVSRTRTPAAPSDAETAVEKFEAGEFVESFGNLRATDRLLTRVARCLGATAPGVVGTSNRDRRVPTGSRLPATIPRLKSHGGHLTRDNVRLAHRLCNRRDWGWRTKINAMFAKQMSLQEIAEELNVAGGCNDSRHHRWAAESVRKAFVS